MSAFAVWMGAAAISSLAAIALQWRDCIPGGGNLMGVRSVLMTLWMLAALATGIGVSRVSPWWWGLAAGLAVMVFQFGLVDVIELSGRSRKPPCG